MTNNHKTAAIVLAAGKGTRMKSDTTKVLHKMGGLPMLDWVVRCLSRAGVDRQVVVISPAMAEARDSWKRFESALFCVQNSARGTGDAAASAYRALAGVKKPPYADAELVTGESGDEPERIQADELLICAGDTPAISSQEIKRFLAMCHSARADIGVLAMRVPMPAGYGRIVLTPAGSFERIVEEKDASDEERKINLCNSGVLFAKTRVLFELLAELKPDNQQKEYYLTDCLGLAAKKGMKVAIHEAADWQDFLGVNDRVQMASVENMLVQRQIAALMAEGVTFHHPQTCRVEVDCVIGPDSVVGSGVCLEGKTQVGRGCRIGHHVVLDDVTVGDRAVIGAGSVVRNYVVNPGEYIPPMSMIQ
ncbi:MAG: hypothetical protein RIQ81_2448 [Pseudomonadota bacterium]|jgi:bifunctional UDP-N-acetylglucosamine pyrophosphorylase/glucosamine-1-phosphate N-acetyltransferase